MSDTRCFSEANRKSCPGRSRRLCTARSLWTTIPLTRPWRKRRFLSTAGSSWRVYSLGTSTKGRCEVKWGPLKRSYSHVYIYKLYREYMRSKYGPGPWIDVPEEDRFYNWRARHFST